MVLGSRALGFRDEAGWESRICYVIGLLHISGFRQQGLLQKTVPHRYTGPNPELNTTHAVP